MPSVRIWTPESDNDTAAVCCIAQKIVKYYGCDITIESATKQAFNDAAREPDGLKKAVDIYPYSCKARHQPLPPMYKDEPIFSSSVPTITPPPAPGTSSIASILW